MAKPANEIWEAIKSKDIDLKRYERIFDKIRYMVVSSGVEEFEDTFGVFGKGINGLLNINDENGENDINDSLSDFRAFRGLMLQNPTLFNTGVEYLKEQYGDDPDADLEAIIELLSKDLGLDFHLDYIKEGSQELKKYQEKYQEIKNKFDTISKDVLQGEFSKEFKAFDDALAELMFAENEDEKNTARSKLNGFKRMLFQKPKEQDKKALQIIVDHYKGTELENDFLNTLEDLDKEFGLGDNFVDAIRRYQEITEKFTTISENVLNGEFREEFRAFNEALVDAIFAADEEEKNALRSKAPDFGKMLFKTPEGQDRIASRIIYDYYKENGLQNDFINILEGLNNDFDLGIQDLDYLRQGLRLPIPAAQVINEGIDQEKYTDLLRNFIAYNDFTNHRFDKEFTVCIDALTDIVTLSNTIETRSNLLSKDMSVEAREGMFKIWREEIVEGALSKLKGIERILGRKPEGQGKTVYQMIIDGLKETGNEHVLVEDLTFLNEKLAFNIDIHGLMNGTYVEPEPINAEAQQVNNENNQAVTGNEQQENNENNNNPQFVNGNEVQPQGNNENNEINENPQPINGNVAAPQENNIPEVKLKPWENERFTANFQVGAIYRTAESALTDQNYPSREPQTLEIILNVDEDQKNY